MWQCADLRQEFRVKLQRAEGSECMASPSSSLFQSQGEAGTGQASMVSHAHALSQVSGEEIHTSPSEKGGLRLPYLIGPSELCDHTHDGLGTSSWWFVDSVPICAIDSELM